MVAQYIDHVPSGGVARGSGASGDEAPDDTRAHPGQDTAIGAERPHLAAWPERGW
jgi:hypothetical protein